MLVGTTRTVVWCHALYAREAKKLVHHQGIHFCLRALMSVQNTESLTLMHIPAKAEYLTLKSPTDFTIM